MPSNKQTQCDKGTIGMEKSAEKRKKSNQPLSNGECCNVDAKLDAPKKELILKKTSGTGKSARKNKKSNQRLSNDECCSDNAKIDTSKKEQISEINKPTRTFWFLARLFLINATKDDLLWLANLIKDFENNGDGDANPDPSTALKKHRENDNEYMAKQLLKIKLNWNSKSEKSTGNPIPHISGMSLVYTDSDGEHLVISREALKSNLTENHGKSVTETLRLVTTQIIDYEFISRLIQFDDELSHLKVISPEQINRYLNKCREDGCLENIKHKIEKMNKKFLSYRRRANYSVNKEKKTALMYREWEDIRLILEKFNKFVSEKQLPYFMYH